MSNSSAAITILQQLVLVVWSLILPITSKIMHVKPITTQIPMTQAVRSGCQNSKGK